MFQKALVIIRIDDNATVVKLLITSFEIVNNLNQVDLKNGWIFRSKFLILM